MHSKQNSHKVLDYEDEENMKIDKEIESHDINEEEEYNKRLNANKNIFHYLTKEYIYKKNEKKHYFTLKTGQQKCFDDSVSLFDPGYKITFNELFYNYPKRLEDFLNKIYFEYYNIEICNLEYIEGNYSFDITSKAELKEKNINAVILIRWKNQMEDSINDQIIERNYSNKIVYEFILDEKNQKEDLSCQITNLNKIKNGKEKQELLDGLKIIEINLFYEVEKILKGEFNTLFGITLKEDGQDWLKLIGLRCWAPQSTQKMKYLLPKLSESENYSHNQYINEAIMNLINGNKVLNRLYDRLNPILEENDKLSEKKHIEKGKKISELKIIYLLFIKKKDPLKLIKLNYNYRPKEIEEIFEDYLKEIAKAAKLPNFIEYLRNNGYIIN